MTRFLVKKLAKVELTKSAEDNIVQPKVKMFCLEQFKKMKLQTKSLETVT
jgi:hypothetical protein